MTFDPSAFFETILNNFINSIPRVMEAILVFIATFFSEHGQVIWSSVSDSLLNSPLNFITRTSPALTYELGSVSTLYRQWEPALTGAIALSSVCLGLAMLGREYFGWSWSPGEWAGRVLLGVMLATSMPRIYAISIGLLNTVNDAILGTTLPGSNFGSLDAITQAVLIVVWIVLGLRVGWRMAYRLIYLDILLILGPLAAICWVIPKAQGYASMWWRAYIGLLVGQMLVVLCFRLAGSLTTMFGGTWAGVLLGIGVLLLAYDMATLLADIKDGGGIGGVVKSTIGVVKILF